MQIGICTDVLLLIFAIKEAWYDRIIAKNGVCGFVNIHVDECCCDCWLFVRESTTFSSGGISRTYPTR
jgi:hypothetical protein